MKNIIEMSDRDLDHRLADLDPMEFALSEEQEAERHSLLLERFRRNREDSAHARMMGHG